MSKVKEYYADILYHDFPDDGYDGFTDGFPADDYDDRFADSSDADTGYFPDDAWPDMGDGFPAEVVPTYKRAKKAS